MPLRQRLENLPVGQKLLAALLVLLTTVLLVANLTFISAAYWISQESMAPQALQAIGRLVFNPALAAQALDSPANADALLNELTSYSPLRAAALYDGEGSRLAQLQHGDRLQLPETAFSYLSSHGSLDIGHMETYRRLMNTLDDPDDQAAVIRASKVVYALYTDMVRNLPRIGEASHAPV